MGIDFYFHKFDKQGSYFDGEPSIQKDLPVGECIYEERQTHSQAWFWSFYTTRHPMIYGRVYYHNGKDELDDTFYTEIPKEQLMVCAFKLDQVINGDSHPLEEFPEPRWKYSEKYDYSLETFKRFRAVVQDLITECRQSGRPLLFHVWA